MKRTFLHWGEWQTEICLLPAWPYTGQSFPGAFRVTEVPLLQGMLCDNKIFSKVYIAATITEAFYLNEIALLLWVHGVIRVINQKEELNWNLFSLKDESCQIVSW